MGSHFVVLVFAFVWFAEGESLLLPQLVELTNHSRARPFLLIEADCGGVSKVVLKKLRQCGLPYIVSFPSIETARLDASLSALLKSKDAIPALRLPPTSSNKAYVTFQEMLKTRKDFEREFQRPLNAVVWSATPTAGEIGTFRNQHVMQIAADRQAGAGVLIAPFSLVDDWPRIGAYLHSH